MAEDKKEKVISEELFSLMEWDENPEKRLRFSISRLDRTLIIGFKKWGMNEAIKKEQFLPKYTSKYTCPYNNTHIIVDIMKEAQANLETAMREAAKVDTFDYTDDISSDNEKGVFRIYTKYAKNKDLPNGEASFALFVSSEDGSDKIIISSKKFKEKVIRKNEKGDKLEHGVDLVKSTFDDMVKKTEGYVYDPVKQDNYFKKQYNSKKNYADDDEFPF